MKYFLLPFVVLLLFTACESKNKAKDEKAERMRQYAAAMSNPAAPGFDSAGSDRTAILIADQVMRAMGGYPNWDSTQYLSWNFFGKRRLLWDKWQNRVRVESTDGKFRAIVQLDSLTGKAFKNGKELTEASQLKKALEEARSYWINDSYWLVMPYKMKDSGVTLTYEGQDTTYSGEDAYVVQLKFKEVGQTPQNKYHVWVSRQDNLVKEWAFFRRADQKMADFTTPWADYKRYGKILLSGNRGDRQLTEIAAPATVPAGAFTSLEPFNWKQLQQE